MLPELTLEQKIGQVLMIGFDGLELHPELREMIECCHLGGLVLFARNVESPAQLASLTRDLQETARANGLPGLLLAIDQEGGRVARLTEDKGFTEFPSAMAMGATGDPYLAHLAAVALAREMRAVGINADFAPVLDVNNNAANPVIGTRSFSFDPQQAAEFGVSFLQGLQEEGILAFGKHFPGHGNTHQDSHFSLPVVTAGREQLEAVELLPFRAAIQAGVAGIMSAHISFPALDPDGLPATLSQRVLVDLLRRELGFEGLLATDSLEMGALEHAGYPAPLAAAAALRAGADLLLFNHGHAMHRQAYATIRAWVEDGRIPMARLDEAVGRVLRAKASFGLLIPTLADPAAAAGLTGQPQPRALSRQIARQSICLLQDPAGRVPLVVEGHGLVLEIPSARGLAARLGLPAFELPDDPDEAAVQSALAAARAAGGVIVATLALTSPGPAAGVLHAVGRSLGQVRLIQALAAAGLPLVVTALRNPFDLKELGDNETAAATWLASLGDWGPALDALADVLLGRAAPQGRIILSITTR